MVGRDRKIVAGGKGDGGGNVRKQLGILFDLFSPLPRLQVARVVPVVCAVKQLPPFLLGYEWRTWVPSLMIMRGMPADYFKNYRRCEYQVALATHGKMWTRGTLLFSSDRDLCRG